MSCNNTITPSTVTTGQIKSLFKSTNISRIVPEVIGYNGNITFNPVPAINNSSEASRIGNALTHLNSELTKFIGPNFSEHLALVDVHNKSNYFQVEIGSDSIGGTTDIVMVPRAYVGFTDIADGALVLFEIKPIDFNLENYIDQVRLVFLASSSTSTFPSRVIVTDLNSKAFGLRMTQIPGRDEYVLTQTAYTSIEAMANHIADFINQEHGVLTYANNLLAFPEPLHPEMQISRNFKRQRIFEVIDCEEYERFKELAEDPELPRHLKYQAASEFLRALGYESPWFSYLANSSKPSNNSDGNENDLQMYV